MRALQDSLLHIYPAKLRSLVKESGSKLSPVRGTKAASTSISANAPVAEREGEHMSLEDGKKTQAVAHIPNEGGDENV